MAPSHVHLEGTQEGAMDSAWSVIGDRAQGASSQHPQRIPTHTAQLEEHATIT